MLAFQEMSLTVYKTTTRGRVHGMVAWNARLPLVGDTDPEKSSTEVGVRYLSFYMTEEEFAGVMMGTVSGVCDIGHNLRVFDSDFTFFDMEFSSSERGVLRVPFVRFSVPYHVRRILHRVVKFTLRQLVDESARDPRGGPDPRARRQVIELPLASRERWSHWYGRGKGEVAIDCDAETREYLMKCREEGGETFARSLESVLAIARNRTEKHTEMAKVRLSKYRGQEGEFSWGAYTPKGRMVMNGGIVNHSRDGGHEWSVHT